MITVVLNKAIGCHVAPFAIDAEAGRAIAFHPDRYFKEFHRLHPHDYEPANETEAAKIARILAEETQPLPEHAPTLVVKEKPVEEKLTRRSRKRG